MPVMKVYPNGVTMGRAPGKNDHERGKRGEVKGWSASAARRNLAFLRSVEDDKLDGYGYTVTFTVRDCPDTADHWKRLREALFKRFERMGMIRGHWVTEWQRRGVPHLHGIFYFGSPGMDAAIVNAWLGLAAEYGVSAKGQHVREVTDIVGWFKYLSKHASRGYQHYQRAADGIPEGWRNTGRVWGYVGEWPIADVKRYQVDEMAFFRLRRIAQRLEIANVRQKQPVLVYDADGHLVPGLSNKFFAAKDPRAISRARRRYKHNDREFSRLRGISEWLPKEVMERLIIWMLGEGMVIRREGTEHLLSVDGLWVDPDTGEVVEPV